MKSTKPARPLRKRPGVIILVAAVVIGGMVMFLRPSEPAYKSRKISEWVADLLNEDPKVSGMATNALRTMGEEALPWLLSEVRLKESALEQKARRVAEWIPFIAPWDRDIAERTAKAAYALNAMGDAALPAMPALMQLLESNMKERDGNIYSPLSGMAGLGTNALPHFIFAMTNDLTTTELTVLGNCASHVLDPTVKTSEQERLHEAVVKHLAVLADSDDPRLRSRVLLYLGKLSSRWPSSGERGGDGFAVAKSACLDRLDDPDTTVRTHAAWALYVMGEQSHEMLQVLKVSAQSPDARLKRLATHALDKIAAESKPEEKP